MRRILIAFALIIGVGCQPDAPKSRLIRAAPPAPVPGWKKADLTSVGFTLWLPEGWKTEVNKSLGSGSAEPEKPGFSQSILGGWSSPDSMAMAMNMSMDTSSGLSMQLLAMGVTKRENVKAETTIQESLGQFEKAYTFLDRPEMKDVELPVGVAKRAKVSFRPGGSAVVGKGLLATLTLYALVDGDNHYEFAFMNYADENSSPIPTKRIMATFRVE